MIVSAGAEPQKRRSAMFGLAQNAATSATPQATANRLVKMTLNGCVAGSATGHVMIIMKTQPAARSASAMTTVAKIIFQLIQRRRINQRRNIVFEIPKADSNLARSKIRHSVDCEAYP
jgi:hypothetical protein